MSRVEFLGGAERVTLTLMAGLPAYGYAPVLTCPDDGDLARKARAEGVTVAPCSFSRMRITADPFTLSSYPVALIRGAVGILKHCRALDVELIHAHHPVGALYCLPAVKFLGLPLILHLHDGLPLRPLYRLALCTVAPHTSRFVCVSNAARQLADAAGLRERIDTVHNGLAQSFLSEPQSPPVHEGRGDGPHIGVFGAVEPRKGQDVFLSAAGMLSADYPSAQFWLVGPLARRDKASYHRRLEQLAAAPDLAGRVHFVGYKEDIASWLRAMDVVVLPSVSHETLGMVLLEAMALGRPVVASRLAGISEAVRDGETGLLVPPGDPQALATAISDVLRSGGRTLAANAAADVRARFSPERFCSRIAKIYDETLSAHSDR